MLGVSQSRNEKLANVFYRLRLIEAYGTGIQKILLSYKCYKKEPIFKTEIGAFLVILPNIHFTSEEKNTEKKEISLTDDYKKILELLNQGVKSRKEIQEFLGASQSKVIGMIKELSKLNLIEKEGNGKNTKYRKI